VDATGRPDDAPRPMPRIPFFGNHDECGNGPRGFNMARLACLGSQRRDNSANVHDTTALRGRERVLQKRTCHFFNPYIKWRFAAVAYRLPGRWAITALCNFLKGSNLSFFQIIKLVILKICHNSILSSQ